MKSSSERTLPASVNSSADASSSIPGAACQLTSTVSSAVGTGALAPLLSSVDTRPCRLWLPAEAAHRHEQADRGPGHDHGEVAAVEHRLPGVKQQPKASTMCESGKKCATFTSQSGAPSSGNQMPLMNEIGRNVSCATGIA